MNKTLLQLMSDTNSIYGFAVTAYTRQMAIDLEDQKLAVIQGNLLYLTPLGRIALIAYKSKDKTVRCELLDAITDIDSDFVGFDDYSA